MERSRENARGTDDFGYEMEELLPVVIKLAEKYTGLESTSITWEKAKQLMDAVLYCIHELEMESKTAVTGQRPEAGQAYEMGLGYVKRKVQTSLKLYNEMLGEFCCFDNQCLYDTVVKGIPEFFKWYDVRFAPQNTILTLDYPVLEDLTLLEGVDRIYAYLRCIRLEQIFLAKFPEEYVKQVLRRYDPGWKEMVDNLCEILYTAVVMRMLEGTGALPGTSADGSGANGRIREILLQTDPAALKKYVLQMTEEMVRKEYDREEGLLSYLKTALDQILARLQAVVRSGGWL